MDNLSAALATIPRDLKVKILWNSSDPNSKVIVKLEKTPSEYVRDFSNLGPGVQIESAIAEAIRKAVVRLGTAPS
jgi:hypothetical protein